MIQAFAAGVLIGVLFFGGLYLTVQRLHSVKYPALLMILSLFARLAILAAGFMLIINGGISNILAAMGGLVLVRFMMIRRFGGTVSSERKEGG